LHDEGIDICVELVDPQGDKLTGVFIVTGRDCPDFSPADLVLGDSGCVQQNEVQMFCDSEGAHIIITTAQSGNCFIEELTLESMSCL